jgi:hypothetical protein
VPCAIDAWDGNVSLLNMDVSENGGILYSPNGNLNRESDD